MAEADLERGRLHVRGQEERVPEERDDELEPAPMEALLGDERARNGAPDGVQPLCRRRGGVLDRCAVATAESANSRVY